MSEPIHQDDDLHGAHSGDAHADPAEADAAHGGHAQGTPLGPIDWAAWGAGLLGVAAGLAVAVCLFISTST